MRFDVKLHVEKIIKFIKNYYEENNLGGVILGISGGKDSAVVAALFTKALGSENVIGVTLPCHSKDQDQIDAKLISDYYGFKLYNFDLTNIFDSFKEEVKEIGDFESDITKDSDLNLKPRLRMSTLYYLAPLFSKINRKTYLVAGTSNKCEIYVGYFTKGGDNVCDIAVLADLTVDEVIKIGEYLNVPNKVLYKKPNDGLSNQDDEEKLGVSYKDIASYMENPKLIDSKIAEKIKNLHDSNKHKFTIPKYIKENIDFSNKNREECI